MLLPAAAVLTSATMSAGYKYLIKTSSDRDALSVYLNLFSIMAFILLVAWVPVPSWEVLSIIALSSFAHTSSVLVRNQAYHHFDLSFYAPLLTGLNVLSVTMVSLFILQEPFSWQTLVFIGLIVGGVMVMAPWYRLRGQRLPLLLMLLPLLHVGFDTLQFVADGSSIRQVDMVWSFYVWHLPIGLPLVIICWLRMRQGQWGKMRRQAGRNTLAVFCDAGGYYLLLYLTTFMSLAEVSGLQKMSVVFVTLLGLVILKEPQPKRRLIAAALITIGCIGLVSG